MKLKEPVPECYACSEPGITKEHAPPQCLFHGVSREGLIWAPSCVEHNSHKSKGDEYLRFGILSGAGGNKVSMEAVEPMIRSLERLPHLMKTFMPNVRPVVVDGSPTIAFTVDMVRFDNAVRSMVQALFYRHHNLEQKLDTPMEVIWTAHRQASLQMPWLQLTLDAHRVHGPVVGGKYPEIFQYDFKGADGNHGMCRLQFYEKVPMIVVWAKD